MGFPHIHMRPKTQNSLNMKLLVLGVVLAFLLLFVLRSNISSAPTQGPSPQGLPPEYRSEKVQSCSACAKLPASISQALVHYATSNITPQQTHAEISVSARVLERKSPSNFLVFGLGYDSPMWAGLNYGGRTVFLEEDNSWIEQVTGKFPDLETYHVTYETKVRHADDLMKVGQGEECAAVIDSRMSKCGLVLKGVPTDIYEVEWDLIMVDAPTGYFEDAPGRMGAIYTAGMMARYRKEGETDVFVHDVDRTVEDRFSKAFLCEGYMTEQEGRLRHFVIPSHRGSSDKPFCP